MFKSIRWTLQLWHAGILALALLCFGVALYVTVARAEFARADSKIEGAARVLASRPMGPPRMNFHGRPDEDHGPDHHHHEGAESRPMAFEEHYFLNFRGPREGPRGPDWDSELPSDVLRRLGDSYYVIWGSDGKAHGPQQTAQEVPRWDIPVNQVEQWARTSTALFRWRGDQREVLVPGPFQSKILVGRSVRREMDDLRMLRWKLLGTGIGILGVGLMGGWLLSTRAIRPIRAITETAKSISANDLSRRIDLEETQSELGTLAQTLNETFERLDTAFQRQVRFTADASHELRTPLTVIHSHTELALTRERTAQEYRQTLEACLRASHRMKSLVESLLVLARADAGKLELKTARFDLKQTAEECIHMVEPLTKEKEISIETDLRPIEIVADRTRISQLMTNLLSNAIRYNRPAGKVKLSLAQEDSQAILTVADTGVGMTEDDQKHIFERFFRADKARSREAGGSGLGLAICQSIVEAHRGSISFTSKPNEGTNFSVRLPLR